MSADHTQASTSQTDDNKPIDENLYWYPDELAVTVQASAAPTLRQLRDLSQRLQDVLNRVGISILPFYAGGHRVTRQSGRPWFPSISLVPPRKGNMVYADGLEAGGISIPRNVEEERHNAWLDEVKRCRPLNRFPGVHFFGKGHRGVAVILYALHSDHRHPGEQQDLAQIAVKLINRHLHHLEPHQWDTTLPTWDAAPLDTHLAGINPEGPQNLAHQQRLRVLAAMPNWLTGPLQYGAQPPTGPGAPPIAAASQLQGRWEFKQQPFKDLHAQPYDPQARVTVIILDTCYKDKRLAAKDQKQAILNAAAKFRQNALLKNLCDALNDGYMTIDDSPNTIADSFRSGQDEYGRPYGYDMVDHGLFVAGIIRGILTPSENRRIELIRIENDYGSGEMDLFLGALAAISARPPKELEHTVLNLSLGVLPPLEQLQEIWFGSNCCCEGEDATSIRQSLDLLDLGVRLPIQTLIEQNVVIVAAAGNDSLGKNLALEPRIPARYEGVLGVAAVDRENEAADYSNRANIYYTGTGLATYGGEQPNSDTEKFAQLVRNGEITNPHAFPDAVCGLYLHDTFPAMNVDQNSPMQPKNEYGWAWWSGTSFATPIISGLAAHYILKEACRGQQVVQKLLSDLASSNPPYESRLQAPILEVQEL